MTLVHSVLVQHGQHISHKGESKISIWNFVTPTWGKNNVVSYAEWQDLTDGIIISFSTSLWDGWWISCLPSYFSYPHRPCDVYISSLFAALWLSFPHRRSYCMLGHCEYSSAFVCPACPSTVLPSGHPSSLRECLCVLVSFSWVLGCVACPISLVHQSHNSKIVPLQSHWISKGRKEVVNVNVTETKSPSHTRFSCEECKF